MKVLHLPTAVGGNAWGLSRGERALGIDSSTLVTSDNPYNFPSDLSCDVADKSLVKRCNELYKLFKRIRNAYDVFHFNYGRSLLELERSGLFLIDLPFYPESAGMVFTYNGSDARTIFPIEYWPDLMSPSDLKFSPLKRVAKQIKIAKTSRYADKIFALNPDLLNFLPDSAEFLPYSISGWSEIARAEPKKNRAKTFKIVHSPTSRFLKGSSFIIEALDRLTTKYSFVEIDIIENVTHQEARKRYESADLIVDQTLIGWYGALGVEAMKMGIPLAVFVRENDLRHIPSSMAEDLRESIINISPTNIFERLSEYIEDRKALELKRDSAYEYVFQWHDPQYVASISTASYNEILEQKRSSG